MIFPPKKGVKKSQILPFFGTFCHFLGVILGGPDHSLAIKNLVFGVGGPGTLKGVKKPLKRG